MTNDSLQPVAADQLRISVEMGDDYQASERVAGALAELTLALSEEEADEVQGFGDFQYMKVEGFKAPSFMYDSFEPEGFCSTVGNKQEPYLRIKGQ